MDIRTDHELSDATVPGGGACAGSDGRPERGAVLIVALFVVVLLSLLGLAFLLTGETESRIARNQRESTQALFAAEGGVRIVRKWFDAPSGSGAYLVPTTSQMDRNHRFVDDDYDGTYGPYVSAIPPFNVIYRQGTNDPFERPYRGTPASMFLGTEAHPDIRISENGSSAEKALLLSLDNTLYPNFPTPGERARIKQIDVYSPPILLVGAQKGRYGIATIKVTAGVFQYAGTAQESEIATRVVKAVVNEVPYHGGPQGPIQSCVNMDMSGNFTPHWGTVMASGLMNLHANLDSKAPSSVPWYNFNWMIQPDMDRDGSQRISPTNPDNQNGNSTLDFDEWLASSDVEDPWLKYWSQGDLDAGGSAILLPVLPGCTGPNCQPAPFYNPATNTLGSGALDHSNLFKNVQQDLCPKYDYDYWKGVALSGGKNVYYYRSDGVGSPNYRLFGTGTPVSFANAIDGKNGLLFFDTGTNSAPVDADNDGTVDNLAADANLAGGGLTMGGFIYLNANLGTSGNGSTPTTRQLIAPGEPYIDANGNGQYDSGEWFLDIDYPALPDSPAHQNGMHRDGDGSGIVRQDPSVDAGSAGKYDAGINVDGVLYTNGTFTASGNWIYFGSVITKAGFSNPGSGSPVLYFDERLIKNTWPPSDLFAPRIFISSWQTEL